MCHQTCLHVCYKIRGLNFGDVEPSMMSRQCTFLYFLGLVWRCKNMSKLVLLTIYCFVIIVLTLLLIRIRGSYTLHSQSRKTFTCWFQKQWWHQIHLCYRFNPVALRTAKTPWSIGCSECSRVKTFLRNGYTCMGENL